MTDFETWWKTASIPSPYGYGGGLYSPASLAVGRRKDAARIAYELKDTKIKFLEEKLKESMELLNEAAPLVAKVYLRTQWFDRLNKLND